MLTVEMIERAPTGHDEGYAGQEPLALTVGCEFGMDSVQPAEAIMQVAPLHEPGVSIFSERWDTRAQHHGYVDQYGNRCERFELVSGGSRAVSYTHLDVYKRQALGSAGLQGPHGRGRGRRRRRSDIAVSDRTGTPRGADPAGGGARRPP